MPKKRTINESDALSDQDRCVTAKELQDTLAAFRSDIIAEMKSGHVAELTQDAPRPRIFHKKKEGKREKIATTIDSALFELVKAKQQQSHQLSHILDSALWNYFGRPRLSFEDDESS